ncbi:MAG: flavodoxin domain-containing protein [Eubacteriales bacterium]|nr:flavodoxin domain-containing protein [Eubacteriales bacterium]
MEIIVYGSQYGTTQRYAEELSRQTGIPAIRSGEKADLSPYQTVIHMGGLYAGSVKGLKTTVKTISEQAELIVVTVGLVDGSNAEGVENIRRSVRKQLPKAFCDKAPVFHLRGGMDYRKLSLGHKAMMQVAYRRAKALPEEKQTPEIQAVLATHHQAVDFVDFGALHPILAYLDGNTEKVPKK